MKNEKTDDSFDFAKNRINFDLTIQVAILNHSSVERSRVQYANAARKAIITHSPLGPSRWKCIPRLVIGGRHIDVKGSQRRLAGITNFVVVASPNQKQAVLSKRNLFAVDYCQSGPGNDIQPLVRTPMMVISSSLRSTRLQNHLGGLRTLIAEGDVKSFSKAKFFLLH